MKPPVKMLLIYVGETDMWETGSLYEAIVRRLRQSTEDHPHASMQTSPEQGQFLHLLARVAGAKNTLEVGVFLGYSSTWVALALPADGRIVACDVSEEYAARARQTWREADVES